MHAIDKTFEYFIQGISQTQNLVVKCAQNGIAIRMTFGKAPSKMPSPDGSHTHRKSKQRKKEREGEIETQTDTPIETGGSAVCSW